jgi:hypothetical protein
MGRNAERFGGAGVLPPTTAGACDPLRPCALQQRKSEPMLFWIAAIGSTWGAYALGFERLIGVADRPEARHGGKENRSSEGGRRRTDGGR